MWKVYLKTLMFLNRTTRLWIVDKNRNTNNIIGLGRLFYILLQINLLFLGQYFVKKNNNVFMGISLKSYICT